MRITYATNETLTAEELENLFLSVDWLSGQYPQKLAQAMANTSMVFTARHEGKLIALASVLDDGVMTAYVHYLLVSPAYQGLGIGKTLVHQIKEHYRDYLYLLVIPEEKRNVSYYENLGFEIIENATPMQNKDISDY
ncbi:MAG: GNAT family N-acetyltransferase [Bacillota bacterium]|nr:GNAT family N-acetyltransferase [Bacillota bacterium]